MHAGVHSIKEHLRDCINRWICKKLPSHCKCQKTANCFAIAEIFFEMYLCEDSIFLDGTEKIEL